MTPVIKDCDLLARVQWINDAVSSKDLGVSPLTSYLIKDGYIYAHDGRMTVGTPFPFEVSSFEMSSDEALLVPAAEFLRVLANRPQGDFEWEVGEDRLTLKRGRFKGSVKRLPADQWPYPLANEEDEMSPLPDQLIAAFKALLPFCSENATKPWATCLALVGGYVYGSNNIVVARSPHGDAGWVGEYLVPRWVVEFVLARLEGLDGWSCRDQHVTFAWKGGAWMRSSLINDKYPPVEGVLTKLMSTDPHVPMAKDWIEAVRRVGKITGDPVVRLREDGIYGSGGEAVMVEDDGSTPVPEGAKETVWDLRFLDGVMDSATHWDPTRYPQPATFKGPNIEGVIMPRVDT